MTTSDFTTNILVSNPAKEVFNAINNPRGWWSAEIEGSTNELNAEFIHHYEDMHRCKIKVVEFIPYKKVVWLVVDNYFSFTKDKTEWKNTKIIFEISEKDGKTQLRFTHEGLVPQYECYEMCSNAWNELVHGSLRSLIINGEGK